ncbi:MAG: hypothetical protein ACEPOV_13445 [Hyphomicrobiales bacterium]
MKIHQVFLQKIVYLLCLFLLFSCKLTTKQSIDEQTIHLDPGWNTISFYVCPVNDSINDVFKPVRSDLIQVEGYRGFRDGFYNPQKGVDLLTSLIPNYAYLVCMKDSGIINISGDSYLRDTIVLKSRILTTRNHRVGYFTIPGSDTISFHELEFKPKGKIHLIHDMKGGLYWDSLNINTIDKFIPGKSYFFMFHEDNIILTKSRKARSSKLIHSISTKDNNTNDLPDSWKQKEANPFFMVLAIPNHMDEVVDKSYIGAFTSDGFCSGFVKVDKETPYSILYVYADDFLEDQQMGFRSSDSIFLKRYDPKDSSTIDLEYQTLYSLNDILLFDDWETDFINYLEAK